METNYEKALKTARNNAVDTLLDQDLQTIADRSGATLAEEGVLQTRFLNHRIRVVTKGMEVYHNHEPAGIRLAILILHYLLKATGATVAGRSISFKEVPQGSLYFQPFRGRVIFTMLGLFDSEPVRLLAAAEELGGKQTEEGDLSFRLQPLPRVAIQYIYYRGEEGIPPDLNLLFDATISEYLSTEDIVVLCEEVNRTLKAALA